MKKSLVFLLMLGMLACMLPVIGVSAADSIDVPAAQTFEGEPVKGYTAGGNWVATENEIYLESGDSTLLFDYPIYGAGMLEAHLTHSKGKGGDGGLLFRVTDANGDGVFNPDDGDSGYWLFVNLVNELCIRHVGADGGDEWGAGQYLNNNNISCEDGFDVKLVWEDNGNINLYINGKHALYFNDTGSPLKGTLCGLKGGSKNDTGFTASSIKLTRGNEVSTAKMHNGAPVYGQPILTWGQTWNVSEESIYLQPGDWGSYLFENKVDAGKMSAYIKSDDNRFYGDSGFLFCVTDDQNDRSFIDDGHSGYWLRVAGWDHGDHIVICEVGGGGMPDPGAYNLTENGINSSEGFTLTAEWDGKGNIKVYVNDKLVLTVDDTDSPLTGDLCGLRVKERSVSKFSVFDIVLYSCTHANTEIKDAKDATCTDTGYTGDTYCKDCGMMLSTGTSTDAKGHGETEVVGAVGATCTEPGYTGDTKCKDCGETVATGTATDAKGHGETEVVGAVEATETAEGYTGDTKCKDCGETIAVGETIPVKTPASEDQPDQTEDNPPETGDLTILTIAVASSTLLGIGLLSRKKRLYN